MPAPAIFQNNAGINSQEMIDKLMKAERMPLLRLQEDVARAQIEIKAFEELRNRARKLSDTSRDLYSFAGPFATKSVISSDPGAITGQAAPDVDPGTQDVEVIELATRHQITSRQIGRSENLPKGKFTINVGDKEIPVDFPGGGVVDLERALKGKAGQDYEVSVINIDSNTALISLRSSVSGTKGQFSFSDPDSILKQAGFIGEKKVKKDSKTDVAFEQSKMTAPTGATYGISPDKKTLTLENGSQANLSVDLQPGTLTLVISSEVSANNPQSNPGKSRTETTRPGPEVEVEAGDIKFPAADIERTRTVKEDNGQKNPAAGGASGEITVVFDASGSEQKRQFRISQNGPMEIPLADLPEGSKIKSIQFDGKDSSKLAISNLSLQSSQEDAAFGPMNETQPAKDAKLKMNGIEITRSSNENITDIIQGASLNLHRPTNGPVQITVKADSEEIKKKITAWVEAYNDLVKFVKENSEFVKHDEFQIDRPTDGSDIREGYRQLKDKSGIFAGDPTARQLVNTVQMLTASSYPSLSQPDYRVLSQIGISTGDVGAKWSEIKDGYLKVDDAALSKALNESPESVKNLFASDLNEDSVPDNGVAFKMTETLKPYIQFAGGLISARIDTVKTRIDEKKEMIASKESSLDKKEQTLREKFGRMESSIREAHSQSEYLKSKLGQ
ncbi:MAG: flagellar filament capping protein FliD [Leptospiraceae bacterium]|nr:flagellar filament capping protein FliD [Leptospiraceae bacterium]MCB1303043.1 flagellar filament capping protein FliD [Leptospiraceae bacterium]